jgi:group I intron endonuclease
MSSTNRYLRGKIYKLVSNVDDKIYIGSTCQQLSRRIFEHKGHSKKEPNRPVYKHFTNIGWINAEIILIEEYPCNNKMELERRERHWIDELKPVLNSVIPTRTRQEYAIDNREQLTIKHREYCRDNKEIIQACKKRDYEKNKEHILQHKKEYYRLNRDKILTIQKQKNICECGLSVTQPYMDKHKETLKHQQLMMKKTNTEQL